MPTTILAAPILTPPSPTENRCYTADELLEISTDSGHRYELIQGELIIMAPAGAEHGDTALGLGARIRVFADDNDLGAVFAAETGFLLEQKPDTVRAPDVGFVRKARLPNGKVPRSYFPGAPDLAVEVVSPGDRADEIDDKVKCWLRYGTRLVWLLVPKTRSITVYRSDGTAQVLNVNDTLDGEDVLPGFRFPVNRLFR